LKARPGCGSSPFDPIEIGTALISKARVDLGSARCPCRNGASARSGSRDTENEGEFEVNAFLMPV
jgi:hypothetical protein